MKLHPATCLHISLTFAIIIGIHLTMEPLHGKYDRNWKVLWQFGTILRRSGRLTEMRLLGCLFSPRIENLKSFLSSTDFSRLFHLFSSTASSFFSVFSVYPTPSSSLSSFSSSLWTGQMAMPSVWLKAISRSVAHLVGHQYVCYQFLKLKPPFREAGWLKAFFFF